MTSSAAAVKDTNHTTIATSTIITTDENNNNNNNKAIKKKNARGSSISISNIIKRKMALNERFFSFEYYPPKSSKGVQELKERVHRMQAWNPQWMDITWGAGGVTSDLTPEIANHIQNEAHGVCLMHLTCTNMLPEKVDIALQTAKRMGLQNILALRGDPPQGQKDWTAIDGGFSCALDLIRYIREQYSGTTATATTTATTTAKNIEHTEESEDIEHMEEEEFCIAVSGYPEGHPLVRKKITDAAWNSSENVPKYWAVQQMKDGTFEGVSPADWTQELLYLKSKIDAGGTLIITQLFYDAYIFIEFVHECRRIGIPESVPILPGIMPIKSFGLFKRMTGFCKTCVPDILFNTMQALADAGKISQLYEYSMQFICDMCQEILDAKSADGQRSLVPGLHIYTMNGERETIDILHRLKFAGDAEFIASEHKRVMKAFAERQKLLKLKKSKKKSAKLKPKFHAIASF